MIVSNNSVGWVPNLLIDHLGRLQGIFSVAQWWSSVSQWRSCCFEAQSVLCQHCLQSHQWNTHGFEYMTHLGRSHLRALAATILLLVIKSTSLELSNTQEKTLIGQPSYQTTIATNTLNGLLPCNLEWCRAVTCGFALIQMISNFCSNLTLRCHYTHPAMLCSEKKVFGLKLWGQWTHEHGEHCTTKTTTIKRCH